MTLLDADHPLVEPSTLPYRLPDFAALSVDHYASAFEAGMAAQLEALDALATNPEPATVENVLHAWERSGELLERAILPFYAVKLADSTPEYDALYAAAMPKLSEHSDAIMLDRRLFDRITELVTRADAGDVTLDAEDEWMLRELVRSFQRAGVALAEPEQERLRALNTRLAELGAEFERLNRDARNAGGVHVSDRAELDGLSEDEVAALAVEGGWRVELVNTTQQPLLAKLHHRGLRQRLFEASVSRALGGEHDTRQLVVDIARARAERASLLGYPHHAALVAEQGCAKTVDAIEALMRPLGLAAAAQAEREASEFAERFAEIEPGATFAPWDWEYVAEIVRGERFALDEAALAEHLQVDAVLAAVYDAAHALYGITFTPRPDLRGHTAETEVYEVHNADGSPVGLFLMDFWTRPTKEGGAWMTSVVNQSHLLKSLPVVTNNCNYTRSTTAISWDDVITMFHEFGHALHGLFADSRYGSRSGTETPRDFVEFPSQVNEHWAWEADRVIPAEWAAKLRQTRRFNIGFTQSEFMQAALLDLTWHTTPLDALPTDASQVEEFERAALASWGVASDLVPPRYRSQYFAHIWGSGYAASYYGYKWAEVMDADAVAWFTENGGGTRANGDHFRATLLAPGGSVDAMATYRTFRGRDPEVGPLLERLGFEL